jgi:hypothetical protein
MVIPLTHSWPLAPHAKLSDEKPVTESTTKAAPAIRLMCDSFPSQPATAGTIKTAYRRAAGAFRVDTEMLQLSRSCRVER